MYSQLHWADLVLNRVIRRLQRRVTCLLQISAPQFVLLFLVLLRFSLSALPASEPVFLFLAWLERVNYYVSLSPPSLFCLLSSSFFSSISIFLFDRR